MYHFCIYANTDFLSINGFTLQMMDTVNCQILNITDDDNFEGSETFSFTLSSSAPGITIPTDNTTMVTITDLDGNYSYISNTNLVFLAEILPKTLKLILQIKIFSLNSYMHKFPRIVKFSTCKSSRLQNSQILCRLINVSLRYPICCHGIIITFYFCRLLS